MSITRVALLAELLVSLGLSGTAVSQEYPKSTAEQKTGTTQMAAPAVRTITLAHGDKNALDARERSMTDSRDVVSRVRGGRDDALKQDVDDSVTTQDQEWHSDDSELLLFKMKSGLELYGELLSIRADSLVVAFDRGGWQYRDGVLSPMNVICHSDLRGVSLPGPRMTIMLALTGFLVGLIVSDVLVHNAEENRSDWFWWHHSLATTCVTITASTLLGAYIGSTMRAGSSSIFQNDEIDVRVLSQYARYKNGEPPYLKTLLPGK